LKSALKSGVVKIFESAGGKIAFRFGRSGRLGFFRAVREGAAFFFYIFAAPAVYISPYPDTAIITQIHPSAKVVGVINEIIIGLGRTVGTLSAGPVRPLLARTMVAGLARAAGFLALARLLALTGFTFFGCFGFFPFSL